MTWMITIYLRAVTILLLMALGDSDYNGPFPGFKQQPVDTVIESSNQSIICQGKGEKPIKVYWLKNGARLDSSNKHMFVSEQGSLTIFGTRKARDEGFYRCVVENKYGRIISNRARVTFPYINPFPVGSTEVRVNKGDKAKLYCHAPKSYPDRNIHWSKRSARGEYIPLQFDNNSHFSTSEDGDLYFAHTSENDQGVYFCSVENNILGSVLKRAVHLKIEKRQKDGNRKPNIWLFQNKIAMKDSYLMLECISHGNPVPKMNFRHERTKSELRGAEQVGNRLRYVFGRYTAEKDERYTCEATSGYNNERASKKAYIRVEAKPSFKKEFEVDAISTDQKHTFSCSAEGIPPVRYMWYFNGKQKSSYESRNLTLQKVMKHHEGVYQCSASNRNGEAMKTICLKVVELAPNFGAGAISPDETTHAVLGDETFMSCKPNGAPLPTITWTKLNNSEYVKNNYRRFIFLKGNTLRILNIRKSDAGVYVCSATNRLGTSRRRTTLLVSGGLAITQKLTKKNTLKTGDTLTLDCVISSSEDIEVIFIWKVGNRMIRSRGRTRIRKLSNKISRLTIKDTINRDTGVYKCIVMGTQNRKDTKEQYIIVSDSLLDLTGPPGIKTTIEEDKEPTEFSDKEGEPNPPFEVQTSEQNGIRVKISWTMGRDNGSPVTRIHIQAFNVYEKLWTILKTINIRTLHHRFGDLLTLSPWSQYKFRVVAENKNGLSKPSKETRNWITTPAALPENCPTDIKGVGIATNKIRVTFKPLKKMEQNGPGIFYIIYYKAVGRSYKPVMRRIPGDRDSVIFTVNNMDSYYRLYEFQMQAENEMGFGPRSRVHTAYTGARTPLEAPQNLKVSVKPPTAFVEATWQDVSKGRQTMRGRFLGYKFLYWIKPKVGGPRIENYQTTGSPPITVELRPFTEYFFQVLAYNNVGDGPVSKEFGPIRTPEAIPTSPRNLMASEASSGTITLTWEEPENKNGIIKEYHLVYFTNPSGKTHSKSVDQNVHKLKLDGLHPESTYTFTLSARNSAGIGEATSVVFNFSKVPSFKPEKPIIVDLTTNSVDLQWSKPNVTIIGFKVFYWRADGSETVRWENDDVIVATINYLKPGRLYYFQLALYNDYGTGPKSDIVQVYTKELEQDEVRPTTDAETVVTNVQVAPRIASNSTKFRPCAVILPTLILLIFCFEPR